MKDKWKKAKGAKNAKKAKEPTKNRTEAHDHRELQTSLKCC